MDRYQLRPLSEEHPEEVTCFKKKFLWASNRSGFYTRSSYEEPWRPRKRMGQHRIPLHWQIVEDLAEAHLAFDRFALGCVGNSLIAPRPEQLAFWCGTMAHPEYTYHTCIDIDAHRRVGHAYLPSRYHPDRWPDDDGRPAYSDWASPYSHRRVPLTWIGLDYFKTARLVYERFPGRLWAFSSASLGLAVWRAYPKSRNPQDAFREVTEDLRDVGLNLEVYPRPPASAGGGGRHHRRPCGMDSGVITEGGVVADPIGQIRLFMEPVTPSFEAIVRAVVERSRANHLQSHHPDLWDAQRSEFDRVMAWLDRGCPDCEGVRARATAPPDGPSSASSSISPGVEEVADEPLPAHGEPAAEAPGVPTCFTTCDISEVNKRHLWVGFVLYLADHGLPCEDSFFVALTTLAKWLLFCELYDLGEPERTDRTKELLRRYVLTKHNGFVTRLSYGLEQDVLDNVDRVVEDCLRTVNDQGRRVFTELRRRRDHGHYLTTFAIQEKLTSVGRHPHPPTSHCPISCGRSSEAPREGEEGWTYVPDDTALPEELERKIVQGLRDHGLKIRKNKQGEYPTIKAITRLVNYLKAGNAHGRRASQELLAQMGFPKVSKERERIKKILYKIPVVHPGEYRSKQESRRYFLDDVVLTTLDPDRASRTS